MEQAEYLTVCCNVSHSELNAVKDIWNKIEAVKNTSGTLRSKIAC